MPRHVKYPSELITIADHLRKRRFDLKLSQPSVARIIGVTTDTVTYWENGRSVPQITFIPAIMKFLGYNPYQTDTSTLGGRVKHYRYMKGLSLKRFAKLLKVDTSTVNSWEENEFSPGSGNYQRLVSLLDS
jgi:DNA-binding transcriptional regulator YiaG